MAKKIFTKGTVIGPIIALGIVYGDIGTSPLYVMNAIVTDAGGLKNAGPSYIVGCLSLIFWTLMLITTVKYILLAMQADNHHEGGIFSLYALVRNRGKWLLFPTLIGGAALLADGTLTPAVTVTSAIEGLKGENFGLFKLGQSQTPIIMIVISILIVLFLFQRFGTSSIGKAFGPLMFIWFSFIGIFGLVNMFGHWEVLKALSPIYGVQILFSSDNKMGFFILGSIFLATTGAEALYSDMGHVGKDNIYRTWPFVYLSLMLSYFGQGAWVIAQNRNVSVDINPFYSMLPQELHPTAIVIATVAAIIASQALITGSYTLVSEAIGLKLLPRLKIRYPGKIKSQSYIGTVNWLLCATTLLIVLFFKSSEHMEAAYGLAIIVTMLMTTILLHEFLLMKNKKTLALLYLIFFGLLESLFLLSSMIKFIHGGYLTLLITLCILMIMFFWHFGNSIRRSYMVDSQYLSLKDFTSKLQQLSEDDSLPLYATNVVYMNRIRDNYQIKRHVLYSIFDQRPKRAKVYWFITVNQTDLPYEANYKIDMLDTRNVVDVQLYLGFKRSQHITIYIRQIVNNLIKEGVIDRQAPRYSTIPDRQVGDFKFVLLNQRIRDLNYLPSIKRLDKFLIAGRLFLQKITASQPTWYGLEFSEFVEETVPLFIEEREDSHLLQTKIDNKEAGEENE
ncbi:potassium transporter Kup [Oenococcus sp. UCMA 16435]|nr:potassium transporter Kup [Oenococcus sp. UCMA 16435]MDI4585154.1 potassium transporter Kup [Oenococcus sp. UCMA 14587]